MYTPPLSTVVRIRQPQVYITYSSKLKLNSVAFSPHANYTDRATAALSANLAPTFADRGCHVVSATDPCGR
jgi:hypothetical protein